MFTERLIDLCAAIGITAMLLAPGLLLGYFIWGF
jgi:hypothetical protein|nr:MAG TPA: cortical protein [Caudoviricetes sp.]